MTKTEAPPETLAYHESGHAIAAHVCGITIAEVTIEPCGSRRGEVKMVGREGGRIRRALVLAGGDVAQSVFTHGPDSCAATFRKCRDAHRFYCFRHGEEIAALVPCIHHMFVYGSAFVAIARLSTAVVRVAEALLERPAGRRFLRGREVAELVGPDGDVARALAVPWLRPNRRPRPERQLIVSTSAASRGPSNLSP